MTLARGCRGPVPVRSEVWIIDLGLAAKIPLWCPFQIDDHGHSPPKAVIGPCFSTGPLDSRQQRSVDDRMPPEAACGRRRAREEELRLRVRLPVLKHGPTTASDENGRKRPCIPGGAGARNGDAASCFRDSNPQYLLVVKTSRVPVSNPPRKQGFKSGPTVPSSASTDRRWALRIVGISEAGPSMDFLDLPVWRSPVNATVVAKNAYGLGASTRQSAYRIVRIPALGDRKIPRVPRECCKFRADKSGSSTSKVTQSLAHRPQPSWFYRKFERNRRQACNMCFAVCLLSGFAG